ncbi:hypothetical protein O3P69_018793 [Scylla paramamosain]|uniref:Uncharacterized protein n=1 Tax=Scylla paramamosain TaxID=85552 RepID=A0AAW0SSI0_SCYPA
MLYSVVSEMEDKKRAMTASKVDSHVAAAIKKSYVEVLNQNRVCDLYTDLSEDPLVGKGVSSSTDAKFTYVAGRKNIFIMKEQQSSSSVLSPDSSRDINKGIYETNGADVDFLDIMRYTGPHNNNNKLNVIERTFAAALENCDNYMKELYGEGCIDKMMLDDETSSTINMSLGLRLPDSDGIGRNGTIGDGDALIRQLVGSWDTTNIKNSFAYNIEPPLDPCVSLSFFGACEPPSSLVTGPNRLQTQRYRRSRLNRV